MQSHVRRGPRVRRSALTAWPRRRSSSACPASDPYVAITFSAVPASDTPGSFQDQLKQAQSGVKAVAGLADAADTFTGSGGGSGLSFLSGGTICSIFTTVPTTTAGKAALARSIIAG